MSPTMPLHHARRTTVFIALAVLVVAVACERARTPAGDTSATSASPAPQTVTTAEFQQLRWLQGSWKGSGGGIDAFYERYTWVDDSTIRKFDIDGPAAAAAVKDSGDITLRGGVVRSGSPERSWIVVSLDSASVTFAPERNASNGFEWRRIAPDAWTARLTWDSAGIARERTYDMKAFVPTP